MSESLSKTNPQILVNGEQQSADTAEVEEQISPVSPDDACSKEKETPAKIQSVLQQVRNQIRSQVGMKSSIVELVQRVRDREMAQVNSEPEGKDASEERKQGEVPTDESKDQTDVKELFAYFEEKLEANKKALREEFEEQMSQVREEMQAYTDKALKDLDSKLQSRQPQTEQPTHPKEQQQSKGTGKKQKPPTAPSLAARRGRVLTRTMTTIIPKTCAPVIVGPRARSETLISSTGVSSRLLPRNPALTSPGSRSYQSHKPLPPACPPLHQRKKSVGAKTKTGN